jgi:hypothetical protein
MELVLVSHEHLAGPLVCALQDKTLGEHPTRRLAVVQESQPNNSRKLLITVQHVWVAVKMVKP